MSTKKWKSPTPLGYVALLTLTWYLTSSLAVLLTKTLFTGNAAYAVTFRAFPFSLLVTATNNVVSWALVSLPPCTATTTPQHVDGNTRRLAWMIGALTAAEIGLSNVALRLLPVALATVVKGAAPLFVMLWGVVFGLVHVRMQLVLCMAAITAGMVISVWGAREVQNGISTWGWRDGVLAGLLCQIVSGTVAGLRWVVTQIFIKGEKVELALLTRVNIRPLRRGLTALGTIALTAPTTLASVFPFVLTMEGPHLAAWTVGATLREMAAVAGALWVTGAAVCGILWAEYELVRVTSSLTVSVTFVMKEVALVLAGAWLLGERVSPVTWGGFAVVQAGVVGYALSRREAAVGKLSLKETCETERRLEDVNQKV